MASIFKHGGPAITKSKENYSSGTFCTVYTRNTNGNLRAAFKGKNPVTAVTVRARVDWAAFKSLSGDYLVSSFGQSAVAIEITGISLYKDTCDNLSSSSIPHFYGKNNVGTRPNARVIVQITGSGSTMSYKCVLVECTLQAQNGDTGAAAYNLSLVGVPI